jgi:methyltransferase-like protein
MMNPYDEVPYYGYAFSQTHPDRLATIGTLLGVNVAPVTKCRVLELGCGDGGNLLPMAYQLPESHFVGVDLSGEAIERGQLLMNEIGLKNVELRQADLMDVSADWGQFDYIIAHGVYTWVPPTVKEKVLAICHDNLAQNGIAYVSYNALPGYHLWLMNREMMQFHTRAMSDPQEIITQAKSLMRFLSLHTHQGNERKRDLYQSVISEHLDQIEHYRDTQQLFHDELSPHNEPVYFHEFARRAAGQGLQFLAEADFFEMQDYSFSPDARRMLAGMGDDNILLREQYLDFLKGRTFRQTLLCHHEIKINRQLNVQSLDEMFLATMVELSDEKPDLSPGVIQKFIGPKGGVLQTDFPLAKAALIKLRQAWPQYLSLEELIVEARKYLETEARKSGYDAGEFTTDHFEALRQILLAAYQSGVIQLFADRPLMSTTLNEYPKVFHLARIQAKSGSTVTNLLHKSVEIESPILLFLLTLLDGTRNRNVLTEELTEWLMNAQEPHLGENVIKDRESLKTIVPKILEDSLPQLIGLALLEV